MDDTSVQHGKQWLEELLTMAGLPASVEVNADKLSTEGSCWLTIDDRTLSPVQVESLLGTDGAVLDAIQYLANTTLNLGHPEEQQTAFTVELGGYRVRRQTELQALADRAIEQVRESGEEYELTALSSAERRQVHTYLKEFTDLETFSRGREPDRRLVIRLHQIEAEPAEE
ncbi:R3H domain-containing nucleic acid-binding protein [Leptolyngbya sp. FACHB-711]|uniref:Jag family protein n=1 Tax=unclassified Leptolyngbya TaxID=2650499 RepID=UPI0016868DE1|nr:R3H domain-containing nucleic acid-binding protein [Leptolyngbya sp. FACHB-711]MBD1850168.1 RNA-binding protein [Cyanobacteria bacterium FACHB-502]MBD2023430.1 RNA-binding protein [Leptolyngbya sp. FACHB-711]